METVYFALNIILNMVYWYGVTFEKTYVLVVNQNGIVRICLNKFTTRGSTSSNYK